MKFARRERPSRLIPLLSLATLLGLAAGCTTAPHPVIHSVSSDPARVVLVNESDYAWRIVAKPINAGTLVEGYVAARASTELILPAAEYTVEQTMLLRGDVSSSTRRFAFTPEAGQAYRWILGTLLSDPLGKTESKATPIPPLDTVKEGSSGGDRE